MAFIICPDCNERVSNFMTHVCKKGSNSPEPDRASDGKTKPELTGNPRKERRGRVQSSERSDEAKARESAQVSGRGLALAAPIKTVRTTGKRSQVGVGSERTSSGIVPARTDVLQTVGPTVSGRDDPISDSGAPQPRGKPVHTKPTQPTGFPNIKIGRPRKGEEHDRPWIALGMTERTYYRRKKEQK